MLSPPILSASRRALIRDIPGVISHWSVLDTSSITTATGVSAWVDRAARRRTASQSTGANQAALTATELQFDGSNDLLFEPTSFTATFVSAQNLPDGQNGGGVGAGFSCTGLCRDPVTGGFVIGNDGRQTEASPGTQQPSLVFTDITGATKTSEIDLTSIAGNNTVQGVAVDPSDGHIWCCTGSATVRKINRNTGAQITSFAVANANGLAIRSDGKLLVSSSSTGNIVLYDQAGNSIATVVTAATVDCMYYEQSTNRIWTFQDAANVLIYSADSGTLLAQVTDLGDMNKAEGIFIEDDTMWVTHNGYYHTGGNPAAAQLRKYTISGHRAYADTVHAGLFFVGNLNAYVSGTICLMQSANPLSVRGYGLYCPNATTMRGFVFNGVSASVDFTTVPTTRSVWHFEMDGSGETVGLRRNGTVVASGQSIAGISGGYIPSRPMVFGGAVESGTPARWSSLRLSAAVQWTGSAAMATEYRTKAEGILAWDHGLEASLDASHPYRWRRPLG